MSNRLSFFLLLCIGVLSLSFSNYFFQPTGLDSAVPISKFLNGHLPMVSPGDGQNLSWSVEPAFPNLQFESPLVIKPHPRQNRLFVASRDGLIEHFEYDQNTSTKQIFVDLRPETGVIWDGGFLGLAFHPDFGKAGSPNRNYFYVFYTAKGPNGEEGPFGCNSTCFSCANNGNFFGAYLRLARYSVNEGSLTVDKSSEVQLFNIRAFNGTHRGGGLNFGQDGFLYLAIGDQGRRTTAQNIVSNFEGGVIRIDVDKQGGSISHPPSRKMGVQVGESDEFTGNDYYIPNDNPWVVNNNSQFEEYYHNGHRNPHRMTMDRVTGDFWIGEVGAGSKEEITIIKKGHNGGWPIYEGNNFRTFSACNSNNLPLGVGTYNPPVVDFLRSEANAIIGGYVYRGAKFPSLYGKYLCGGYSKNNLFVIDKNANGDYNHNIFANFSPGRLITWGEGPDAELFMGKQTNPGQMTTLYQLKATGNNPPAPILLSQTGAFSDLDNLTPTNGLIPYELIQPFWSDGSDKARWIAIPNNGTHNTSEEQIQFSENGNWTFPRGTVIIKHFELGGKRLETRFEVKGQDDVYYYLSYKWNEEGTDATLLTTGLDEQITVNGQTQIYHYPSPSECLTCHQNTAGSVLGLKTRYLNKAITYPLSGETTNQLVALSSIGAINQNITNAATNNYITVAAQDDMSQSLELRARSYLDVNCSGCHQPNINNRALFDARITTPLTEQNLIEGGLFNNLTLNNPKLIIPGQVNRSMIHFRLNTIVDEIKMPPIGKNKVDVEGAQLIADWINDLANIDPDNDGDGLPASQDCNDNDPNLTTIGSDCDDGNTNTINDVVQANCTCAGTAIGDGNMVTENCNDNIITHGNGTITLTSGGSAIFFKVLTKNWQPVDHCGFNCGSSFTVNNLPNGEYRVFFENANYQTICNKTITIGSGGTTDPDNDGDGLPASQDCNDNDPNLTTVGSDCDDGNTNTINDVVQANCTCAGTAIGDGNMVTENCNDNIITHGNGTITLTSGGSAIFFKVLTKNWQPVDHCGFNCGSSFTVNNLPNGEYRVFFENANYQTICNKTITIGGTTDPDNDGDGLPASQDCNDNDPNLTTVGSNCNDGNANTINDVVQTNCTCAGTAIGGGNMVTENCNDNIITHGNGTITLTSGGSAFFFKVLTKNWQPVDHCGFNCGSSFTVNNLPNGEYRVFFENANYQTICNKTITIGSGGTTDPDNDGDGLPASQDCNDNDPNLTTVGSNCNDGNANTINDVVQANCTCAGTATGGGGGTTITEDCNGNAITHGNGTITLTSNGSASFFQILNSNYDPVDHCGWQCDDTFIVSGLPAGRYLVYFLDDNYTTICEKWIDMTGSANANAPTETRASPHLSFTAFPAARKVDLQWLTNTGYFNDYFVVEKSVDGQHFEAIQRIKSQALGTDMTFNQTIDSEPRLGENYYRIKQVYRDGDFDYTDVQFVDFKIDLKGWSVFPNPAENELFVNLKPFAGKTGTLQLVNNVGQVIQTKELGEISGETQQLDIREIENGLYFINIKIDGQKALYQKIIIERMY